MSAADLGGPRQRTRWVKFQLRGLMISVGVVAIGLGWWVNSTSRQKQAVQTILARGGTIQYDYQYDATFTRRLPKGEPSRPLWLQQLLGDDYFHDVVMVGLDDVDPADADLAELKDLPEVKLLYLGGGRITDAGLEHLQNLTELRELYLWGNPISGKGLKYLSRLRQLRILDLSKTPVADDHLTYLKSLTGLQRIDLANNPELTGSFLEHLADLPQLEEMVLRGSGITDSALGPLKHAKKLKALMLDGTRITDAGMVHLRGLTSLGSLDVSGTRVSQAIVQDLHEWFPNASVKPALSK